MMGGESTGRTTVYARRCHNGRLYHTAVVVVSWLSVSMPLRHIDYDEVTFACFVLGGGTNHTQMHTPPDVSPQPLGFPI